MATKKRWVYCPPRKPKPKVPESIKIQVETRANHLIESTLRPEHIKPPPADVQFNYIVDLYSKWYHSYFYFCAKYRCPAPNRISDFFELRFARMEYAGADRFHLSYMRHMCQWWDFTED